MYCFVGPRRFIRPRAAPAVVALMMLAACKGGSGTSGSPTASFDYTSPYAAPAPVQISKLLQSYVQAGMVATYDAAASTLLRTDPRYTRQASNWHFSSNPGASYSSYPLLSSGVAFAHAAGLTGAGQTVGVIDSMVNSQHEVFRSGQFDYIYNGQPNPSDPSTNNHGTMTSSIIAGSSPTFIGVAPGASLDFTTYQDLGAMANATMRAYNNNFVAQNNSWGYDQTVSQSSFDTIFSGQTGTAYMNALDAYASRGVTVFSVSNDQNATHATIMDALPYLRPGLEAGWIAVGNATPDIQGSTITGVTMQSAGCLEAARWCILADGAWEAADNLSNNSYTFEVGSSFAAPQVSGALALLAEAFPTLTPHELRARLLASANDNFFRGDGTVELATGYFKRYSFQYGVGFLDVRAALLPIGPTALSLPNGVKVSTERPVVVTGRAMGDAVSRSLRNIDVTVTDALSTPFGMNGSRLASSVAPTPLATRTLGQALSGDLALRRTGQAGAIDAPFADFSGQSMAVVDPSGSFGISVLTPSGSEQSYGVSVKHQIGDGPTRVEVGVKLAHDGGSVMGFGGSDNGTGANLAALQLGLTQDIGGGGFVSLAGEMGMADLGQQVAMSNISEVGFNSIKVAFGSSDVFDRGDRLSISAGLPIAVTNGHADMMLPVFGRSGRSIRQPVAIDLGPTNRQLDIGINYQCALADNFEMVAQLLHSENYGNQSGLSQDAAVIGFKLSF